MRLLMIGTGYLPYMFSENLCNGKLVYALQQTGIDVDFISKVDLGPSYGSEWREPWTAIRHTAVEVNYPVGGKLTRLLDYARCGATMDFTFKQGIRWARRAYEKALQLISQNHYDAILTRSPGDIAHLVGYKLKKKTGLRWIANWNDPADPIWPGAYKHNLTPKQQRRSEQFTAKLLQAADVNTFPSDSLRCHFIKHFPFLADTETDVIPHIGLHESIFNKCSHTRGDVMRICHSGNLSGERDPHLLFEAMRQLIEEGVTDFSLDIMGHANSSFNALIQQYGLQNHVRIAGSYDYLTALDKMQGYDVLMLLEAKLEEGIFFASKLTDYAQTGLPILAVSPAKGFARTMITRHGAGIFADNTDVADIKRALTELLALWREDRLSDLSSGRLFAAFAPAAVIAHYRQLLQGE